MASEPGEEIVEAWLYLGGELVAHKSAPPGSEMRGGIILPVTFDSTHFSPHFPLEQKVVGLTNSGTYV